MHSYCILLVCMYWNLLCRSVLCTMLSLALLRHANTSWCRFASPVALAAGHRACGPSICQQITGKGRCLQCDSEQHRFPTIRLDSNAQSTTETEILFLSYSNKGSTVCPCLEDLCSTRAICGSLCPALGLGDVLVLIMAYSVLLLCNRQLDQVFALGLAQGGQFAAAILPIQFRGIQAVTEGYTQPLKSLHRLVLWEGSKVLIAQVGSMKPLKFPVGFLCGGGNQRAACPEHNCGKSNREHSQRTINGQNIKFCWIPWDCKFILRLDFSKHSFHNSSNESTWKESRDAGSNPRRVIIFLHHCSLTCHTSLKGKISQCMRSHATLLIWIWIWICWFWWSRLTCMQLHNWFEGPTGAHLILQSDLLKLRNSIQFPIDLCWHF